MSLMKLAGQPHRRSADQQQLVTAALHRERFRLKRPACRGLSTRASKSAATHPSALAFSGRCTLQGPEPSPRGGGATSGSHRRPSPQRRGRARRNRDPATRCGRSDHALRADRQCERAQIRQIAEPLVRRQTAHREFFAVGSQLQAVQVLGVIAHGVGPWRPHRQLKGLALGQGGPFDGHPDGLEFRDGSDRAGSEPGRTRQWVCRIRSADPMAPKRT